MSEVTIDQALSIALEHHRAGRLPDAEGIYRQVLAQHPNHPDALHFLGALASQVNRDDIAVELIRRAIACGLNSPEAYSNLGNALKNRGALDEAIAACRKAIVLKPDFAEAYGNLGNALNGCGDFDAAIAACRQAIALRPEFPQTYSVLGNALRGKGEFDAAIDAYRQAIALWPPFPEAYVAIGDTLRLKGDRQAAIASYRQAIALRPDYPGAYSDLGNALRENGELDAAIAACRQAIALQPGYPEAHSNLGNALYVKGELDAAIASYRQAVAHRANYPEALSNLGNALLDKGDLEGAIAACGEAIALRPNLPEGHNNLSNALFRKGDLEGAIASCRRAIALKFNYPDAHSNLANALRSNGELDAAIAAYRQAIALQPDYAVAYNNLANALKDMGMLDDAISCCRKALSLNPGLMEIHSNLLINVHYHVDSTGQSVLEESLQWAQRHAEPLSHLMKPHSNDRDPDRRLRIGYVSPDFREHVVGRAILPFLAECDGDQLESICYNNAPVSDAMTQEIQAQADQWRQTAGLSRDQLAELIRQDRIDILVDLSSHSSHHRLLTFACKPAPVQVTWLGFPGTTGMRAMDYRITDSCIDPPDPDGLREALYVERSIRLPGTAFCYQAPKAPPVNPLPATVTGRITFGCLNNFCKVTPPTLDAWAQILKATPSADLLLYAAAGDARRRITDLLAKEGIDPARLRFVGFGGGSYFDFYHQIDISLDPFPFTGSTTTCDSLWMGVPVITLTGPRIVSRLSLTILSTLGLAEWVAHDTQEYVKIATALAGDLPRLADLRANLRLRMRDSALMDAKAFARNMQAAYRTMWRQWCAESS